MKQFWLGVLITVLLHSVWFLFPREFLFIGLLQFIYVVPLMAYAATKEKEKLLQGILFAAGLTFLVNAACFGIVLRSFL